MEFSKARAAAEKILGKDAKIPETPPAVTKALSDFDTANGEFRKSREDCESKLLAIQNSVSAIQHALEQYKAKLEKSDFDLNPKTDKKKIDQADKILASSLAETIKHYDGMDKTLKDLDKHLIQLGKYKQEKSPI